MEYTVRIAGTPCETRVSGGTLAEACALLGHPLELVCGGNGPLREMRCSRGAPRRARDRARVHHARHGGHHRFS